MAAKRTQSRSAAGRRNSQPKARSGRGGGWMRVVLWLIVIGLLSVIARYAYIAAQPDKGCHTLLADKIACDRPADYSDSDRAKLEDVVEKAMPKP